MQCGARDRAATHKHRLQYRHRRQNSGASDLNKEVVQARLDAFRRIFVSDRPARRFRREPKPLALGERIHLDYCAVGLVRKTTPNLVKIPNPFQNFAHRIGQPPIFMSRQTEPFEKGKDFRVKFNFRAFDYARSVKNDPEWTLRNGSWIEML